MAFPILSPSTQLFDDNGVPLNGGLVYVYEAGTTTPKTSYPTAADADAGTSPNTNPVVLNASGRGHIWGRDTETYKIVIKTSADVLVDTVDDIAAPDIASSLRTDLASTTAGEGASLVALESGMTVQEGAIQRVRSEGAIPGRNVHIYEWGSPFNISNPGGNEWCFVRTPDNYDPHGEPHQLLILNHGNGWIMDGTESTANFSSKTQFGVDTQNGGTYLDTERADYVQYSSPMIEAFLAEGYVVAGAQNDGQRYGAGSAGFGNRETIQNIKFFFEHLVKNFNVTNYCHMIGASNGCIATLNATTIMGRDKVRSIILLYPLINLHAAWSSTYEDDVATAYGFDATPTSFSAFIGATETHDPMNAYTGFMLDVDGSKTTGEYANSNYYRLVQDAGTKDLTWLRENRLVDSAQASETGIALTELLFYKTSLFPWPRIRCHYSLADTVVPQEYHWLAFEKLCKRNLSLAHTIFGLEVTGEHGDYTHFEGNDGTGVEDMISWTQL